MSQSTSHCYEFGPFRLHPLEQLLQRNGESVALSPKVFALLLLLVQNHGHLLQREALIRALWPDSFVEEGNLSRYISTLRQALNEDHARCQYILTVPKRGYRFVACVREAWAGGEPTKQAALPGESALTLAVLPFQPLVATNEPALFALGLADTLITKLSGGPAFIKPTSAVRRYAGLEQDAVAVGRELGVAAVLEGSLQWATARLRVTARLLRVVDGASLWGGQFDEPFTDSFLAQDAIAARVAEALAVNLRVV